MDRTGPYIFVVLFVLSCSQLSYQQPDQRLPHLGPLASNLSSVSGFSSGGALSFQFYMSHSSVLRGVGIFSGLIYGCGVDGRGWEILELLECVRPPRKNYANVLQAIKDRADEGLFDPLSNLKSQRQFVSHGTGDQIVNIEEGERIAEFFQNIGTRSSVIFNKTTGSHGYPTRTCGQPCPTVFPPAVSGCLRCGWSGAFESLNHIYGGGLNPPTDPNLQQCSPKDNSFSGLTTFNQREFFPRGSESTINMHQTGYLFIPTACQSDTSQCTVHVHIHGCGQEASSILVRRDYIKCSGMLAVAEANNIIVIFPQAAFGFNSLSSLLQCWDFIGYTGPQFGTKNGTQIMAIKGMVDRVLATSF